MKEWSSTWRHNHLNDSQVAQHQSADSSPVERQQFGLSNRKLDSHKLNAEKAQKEEKTFFIYTYICMYLEN